MTVAFDAQNTAKAYLLYECSYLPLTLAQSCSCYTGMALLRHSCTGSMHKKRSICSINRMCRHD